MDDYRRVLARWLARKRLVSHLSEWGTDMIRLVTAAATAAISLAVLIASCGPEVKPAPLDQVSVRLKWAHSAQFAGMYVADARGFYAEEGIEVGFLPGGPDVDELDAVASGEDDFGIVTGSEVCVARSQGRKVKAIAVVFRLNPTVYVTLADSGIEKPEDFAGKRVRVNPRDFVLPAMMRKVGTEMSQLQAMPPASSLEDLIAGELDVCNGYLTDQVMALRDQGHKLRLFHPDDYGVHVYNDLIITTDEMVEEKPGLVERFLRATLRGWRYAVENPEEAVAVSLTYSGGSESHEAAAMLAQIPLIHTGVDEIGWMKDSVWEGMHQILLEQGVLESPIDVTETYTTVFQQLVYED